MTAIEELMFVARDALKTAGFSVFLEQDYATPGLPKPNNSDFSLISYEDPRRNMVFVEDSHRGMFICTLKSGGSGKMAVSRVYLEPDQPDRAPKATAWLTGDWVVNLADPSCYDQITKCILACR